MNMVSNEIKHVNETFLLGKICSENTKSFEISNNSYMITFMVETTSDFFSKKENKYINTNEKHKVVCFDSIARKIEDRVKKGNIIHIIGSNRTKKINSNKSGIISRDVVAKHISIMEDYSPTKDINISIILGRIISDDIKMINEQLGTFMVETVAEVYSEKRQKLKTTKERHKIVCFRDTLSKIEDKIEKNSIVYVIGSNRSKKIKAGEGNILSRDIVANDISVISRK